MSRRLLDNYATLLTSYETLTRFAINTDPTGARLHHPSLPTMREAHFWRDFGSANTTTPTLLLPPATDAPARRDDAPQETRTSPRPRKESPRAPKRRNAPKKTRTSRSSSRRQPLRPCPLHSEGSNPESRLDYDDYLNVRHFEKKFIQEERAKEDQDVEILLEKTTPKAMSTPLRRKQPESRLDYDDYLNVSHFEKKFIQGHPDNCNP
ncbi:hypothetical protein L596_025985 [Steinernema carpocapsae]|uniref:Uncharacterized protein n=1 Tax=Steinernema carpocapsae TaxID=34508 RepID=A0A4U5M014_STECR|nr:hypothetical protein L596_025985 [Steinernema carpocapsae]